jgi:organic radical activating enzyme
MDLSEVVDAIWAQWPVGGVQPMVVFTGGEPLLQLDTVLIQAVQDLGFYVAVETNGTMPIPNGIDWVCVSPKILTRLHAKWAHELKLVYPQASVMPELLVHFPADIKWLSPMDGPDIKANTEAAIEYVMRDPRWRLNVQTHKAIGVK